MRLVHHAEDRLAERGITMEDIQLALSRPTGQPQPGTSQTTATVGYASGGRRLKVVRSAADTDLVVSAYWVP